MVFADLWPHPTNKQVLITRNSILLDYSSIVRNVGEVLFDCFHVYLQVVSWVDADEQLEGRASGPVAGLYHG